MTVETVFRLGPRGQARRDLLARMEADSRAWAIANLPPAVPAAPAEAVLEPSASVAEEPARPARKRRVSPLRWTDEQIFDAIRAHAAAHGGIPPSYTSWPRATADRPSAAYIGQRIGWANAIQLAGFPRPRQTGARS